MSGGPERPLAEVRFLTVAEVASLMRVSKMTVYRLVHAGELPAVRVGRSFRVPEQAVHDRLCASGPLRNLQQEGVGGSVWTYARQRSVAWVSRGSCFRLATA
jgi:excisionase family DNA binding protein